VLPAPSANGGAPTPAGSTQTPPAIGGAAAPAAGQPALAPGAPSGTGSAATPSGTASQTGTNDVARREAAARLSRIHSILDGALAAHQGASNGKVLVDRSQLDEAQALLEELQTELADAPPSSR
jgi:hypothetical protein